MFGFGLTSFLLLFVGIKTSKEHFAMQTFFTIVGLYFIIMTIGIAETVAASSGLSEGTITIVRSGVTVISYAVYIFIFYFMLNFLVNVLSGVLPTKKMKRRW